MNRLTNKVAIVTGASSGIGAAIAKALAEAGASVVVNYASSREGAEKTVAAITAKGGVAIAVPGDVSKAADVQRLFEETVRAFGAPSVLVNNAGVVQFEPVGAITEAEFHRQYGVNVLGPLFATQEAVKHFPAAGGSIINISSISSKNPPANSSLSSSTKGALDTLTLALAKELGPKKIRVNTVAPGGTETEGAHRLGFIGGEFEKMVADATPLGRFGRPGDIAPVVVFLASDDSAWLTGERISASGGLH
ncbi:oxidoreductase [Capsulimonas corticalis]|uniref:Oxidoreductase n=1 Tax=Capsulimonas corticalis TaxID=2219043 RepID=A0A402CSF9_9BACT|nr:glucose 1-dehydrogenase [Capsulimonas corticalis]BDI31094.1 oxidoreductase [Capsulimonas corticalis]